MSSCRNAPRRGVDGEPPLPSRASLGVPLDPEQVHEPVEVRLEVRHRHAREPPEVSPEPGAEVVHHGHPLQVDRVVDVGPVRLLGAARLADQRAVRPLPVVDAQAPLGDMPAERCQYPGRAGLSAAVQRGSPSRVVSSLVKPSCLIVDEVGRCVYDRPCTDLFFDVVDRRYEKEGPNAMVLTSNIAPSGWDEFFTGDDTPLCALDRLFDKASVFVMRGPSYRGRELDTYSVEAVPQAVKVRGIQPEGM